MPEFKLHDSWFEPAVLISVIEGNAHSRVPHRLVGEPQPVTRGDAPIDLHVDYPPPYRLDN